GARQAAFGSTRRMKTSSGSGAHSPPSRRITVSTGASARAGPWISTIPPSSRADERAQPHDPSDPASSNVSSHAKQYSHLTGVGASMSVIAITSLLTCGPASRGEGGAPDRSVNPLGPPARRPLVVDPVRVLGTRAFGLQTRRRRAPVDAERWSADHLDREDRDVVL